MTKEKEIIATCKLLVASATGDKDKSLVLVLLSLKCQLCTEEKR